MKAAKLMEILNIAPEWADAYASTILLCIRVKRVWKKGGRENESRVKKYLEA